jgi:hypothetical protein
MAWTGSPLHALLCGAPWATVREHAMDPNQFDAMTKALAGGVTRRRALMRLGAGVLAAGLVVAVGRDCRDGTQAVAQAAIRMEELP